MQVWSQEIRDDVYTAIATAADTYGVPRALMFSISKFEAGFRPEAEGDGGCSIGLFQLNTCGGVGSGYDRESLKDPTLNAQIAAAKLAQEYALKGDWYAAAWPWSVRPNAWAWMETHGDPTSGEPVVAPAPSAPPAGAPTPTPQPTPNPGGGGSSPGQAGPFDPVIRWVKDHPAESALVGGLFAAALLLGGSSSSSRSLGGRYGY